MVVCRFGRSHNDKLNSEPAKVMSREFDSTLKCRAFHDKPPELPRWSMNAITRPITYRVSDECMWKLLYTKRTNIVMAPF